MKNNRIVTCALVFMIAIMMAAPWAAIATGVGKQNDLASAKGLSDDIGTNSMGDIGLEIRGKHSRPIPTANKYAVVIGISNYYGTQYDLQYCEDDARDWAQYLNLWDQ